MVKRRGLSCFALSILAAGVASGSSITIGPVGINSAGLGLTGDGIFIGQVEPGRPGRPVDDSIFYNSTVRPLSVYRRDMDPANEFDELSVHAVEVAGVMISTDNTDDNSNSQTPIGVATDSFLVSSAYQAIPGSTTIPSYEAALLSMTYLAREFGGEVRAINFSAGEPRVGTSPLDGNSLLTLGVDWSARKHDVLYITAGDETGSINPGVPTDNYNGMTIGSSIIDNGKYSKVAPGNVLMVSSNPKRALIDLIAPGVDVEVATRQSLGVDQETIEDGTSYAAPHVTGSVALLQEYAVQQMEAVPPNPRFTANSEKHEVMKAVLLNSADKIQDTGDGKRLGMERTVLDKNNNTWLQSEAFLDANDPDEADLNKTVLDDQMGAGHLNAKRALTQFKTGEYESSETTEVPLIGWDYGTTDGPSSINKYLLNEPITTGQYVSMTLAWDRRIQFGAGGFGDQNSNGEYDAEFDETDIYEVTSTDSFQEWDESPPELSFNRMYLYLVPAGATSSTQAVASSISDAENLQHIFFQVTQPGDYEIWVEQLDVDPLSEEVSQDYALAWWMEAADETILGDFNGDSMVDGADLAQWKGDFGVNDDSDADGDGDSDGADFLAWQRNFGTGVPAEAATAAIPEPSALILSAMSFALVIGRRSRGFKQVT